MGCGVASRRPQNTQGLDCLISHPLCPRRGAKIESFFTKIHRQLWLGVFRDTRCKHAVFAVASFLLFIQGSSKQSAHLTKRSRGATSGNNNLDDGLGDIHDASTPSLSMAHRRELATGKAEVGAVGECGVRAISTAVNCLCRLNNFHISENKGWCEREKARNSFHYLLRVSSITAVECLTWIAVVLASAPLAFVYPFSLSLWHCFRLLGCSGSRSVFLYCCSVRH